MPTFYSVVAVDMKDVDMKKIIDPVDGALLKTCLAEGKFQIQTNLIEDSYDKIRDSKNTAALLPGKIFIACEIEIEETTTPVPKIVSFFLEDAKTTKQSLDKPIQINHDQTQKLLKGFETKKQVETNVKASFERSNKRLLEQGFAVSTENKVEMVEHSSEFTTITNDKRKELLETIVKFALDNPQLRIELTDTDPDISIAKFNFSTTGATIVINQGEPLLERLQNLDMNAINLTFNAITLRTEDSGPNLANINYQNGKASISYNKNDENAQKVMEFYEGLNKILKSKTAEQNAEQHVEQNAIWTKSKQTPLHNTFTKSPELQIGSRNHIPDTINTDKPGKIEKPIERFFLEQARLLKKVFTESIKKLVEPTKKDPPDNNHDMKP